MAALVQSIFDNEMRCLTQESASFWPVADLGLVIRRALGTAERRLTRKADTWDSTHPAKHRRENRQSSRVPLTFAFGPLCPDVFGSSEDRSVCLRVGRWFVLVLVTGNSSIEKPFTEVLFRGNDGEWLLFKRNNHQFDTI